MRRIHFVALTLIALAGCGLGDYEKRMDEKREQLRLFDEEAQLLGNLIEMPTGKDAYGTKIEVPFEIFLRMPKTVAASFKGPEAVYYGAKLPLFRYYGKADVNIFVAWAKVKDTTATAKASGKDDEIVPEEFRSKVRAALIDFISREYRMTATPPEFDKLKTEKRETMRDGQKVNLHFESAEFSDPRLQNPSKFFVNFLTLSYNQAAVIYQVPASQADQTWLRSADVSLKTLNITADAPNARNRFRNKG